MFDRENNRTKRVSGLEGEIIELQKLLGKNREAGDDPGATQNTELDAALEAERKKNAGGRRHLCAALFDTACKLQLRHRADRDQWRTQAKKEAQSPRCVSPVGVSAAAIWCNLYEGLDLIVRDLSER